MGSKNIKESQEQQEGKAIRAAGRDVKVPDGQRGSHESKKHPVELHIPNRDSSSSTDMRKAEGGRKEQAQYEPVTTQVQHVINRRRRVLHFNPRILRLLSAVL